MARWNKHNLRPTKITTSGHVLWSDLEDDYVWVQEPFYMSGHAFKPHHINDDDSVVWTTTIDGPKEYDPQETLYYTFISSKFLATLPDRLDNG